ncbi:bifunctional preprotein translocase subunit SecD/SecF [Spiroplasma sabaudiense Ar-1343]|uniref:Bifunctional preprotein translocase subunit SecD/SecF n=1 Tax=Spiroplasma sabaudiense Ar-1343 TaxID=1276257 RepID=W6A9Q3_9MOLU|nr:protein translocase SecDF, variant type [Spiroplasma sabaudiense]AHI53747.1 bifunctional preprotein translocase subunit SecD/SecF [Spiroplasma sabaudiense Ar-1343]
MKNKSFKSKTSKKNFFRFFTVILITLAMVFGVFLSSASINESIKLGKDFSGSFVATVGVFDNSKNNSESSGSLPNGDAAAAAEILSSKIDPMGNQQINVRVAGKNYLRVSAPKSSFDNNESRFRSDIQRSGGIFIFNSSGKDLLFGENNERTKMSDVFSGASATTMGQGTRNAPFIRFELPTVGGKFSEIVDSLNPEEGQAEVMSILTDVDGLFEDVRSYYSLSRTNQDEFLETWFNKILKPLRETYLKSQNPIQRKVLFDLFFGEYSYVDINGTTTLRESLIAPNSQFQTVEDFRKVMDSWHYLSDTTKYIYDPNSVKEDFIAGGTGKYSQPIKGYTENSTTTTTDLGNIKELFEMLSDNLVSLAVSVDETNFAKYFLYQGNVSKSEPSIKTGGFIGDSGKAFFAETKTFTQAKSAEAAFAAASKGFSFFVFSVSEESGLVSPVFLIISAVVMILIAILIAIFLLVFYRLLGLFTIIIISTTVVLMMVFANLFALPFGVESIAAIAIVVGLILDMSITLFESMKRSMYLKKRSFRSSFIISHRDTLGGVIDASVVLIIPNMILFWNASNVLKSFATLVTLGGFLTIFFAVVVMRLMVYLIAKTDLIDRNPKLFALNTTVGKKSSILIEIKYNSLNHQIRVLENPNPLITKITKINEKIAFYKETNQELQVTKLTKILEKLEAKQGQIVAKNQEKLIKVKKNLEQLKVKRQAAIEKNKIREENYEKKLVEKLELKIKKFEAKKDKLQALESPKKIFKLEAQIEENKYLINNNFSIETELLESDIIEGENNSVAAISEPVEPKTTAEKIRVKRRERGIFKFSKVFLIIIMAMVAFATILGLSVGPNYDRSYGHGTEFFIWGDYIETSYSKVEDLSKNTWWIEDVEVPSELQEKAASLVVGPSVPKAERLEKETKAVAETLEFIFSNNSYFRLMTNSSLSLSGVRVNYGTNYTPFDQTGAVADPTPWIMFEFRETRTKTLKAINNVLVQFTDKPAGSQNDASRGVERLILNPFSSSELIKQLALSTLIIIAALIIYILIRFKWTYYVAITLAMVFGLAAFVSSIIVFQIPLGFTVIISGSLLISFILINAIMILNHGKILIQSKNEYSLTLYFNKEIDISVNNRENKAIYRKEIAVLRKELRGKLKSKEITKVDKKELKKQFKIARHDHLLKLRELKKANAIKLSRAAKENNYLKEVIVDVMNFAIKRLMLIGVFYLAISAALVLTMPKIFSFGLSLLIGVAIAMLVTMFIIIPIWIFLEQTRLRNRLAFKRYVNSLKVSQEEQIIEGIND